MEKVFLNQAMGPENTKWQHAISRKWPIYNRAGEIRTEFGRDYTRILHSMAYRRLKYKTQVYYLPTHDHISTRIDHVHYVVSISRLIADYLGLNGELTEAIALGHDLGHTPFGHVGERIIAAIASESGIIQAKDSSSGFWHGQNGLRVVDDLELLSGPDGRLHNLNLCYAVRDGIISHSGPIGILKPRSEAIDLSAFNTPGQFMPYTWEACVVKLADNIAYLGRDIEDAMILGLLDNTACNDLTEITKVYAGEIGDMASTEMNNANIIHLLVTDLCHHSNPRDGIGFSKAGMAVADAVLNFNREKIYNHPKLQGYREYGERALERVAKVLLAYCEDLGANRVIYEKRYPLLISEFYGWLKKYWDQDREPCYANRVIYDTKTDDTALKRAVIDYLSEMTDRYVERVYREQIIF